MKYKIEESWLSGVMDEDDRERMLEEYLDKYKEYLKGLSILLLKQECISGMNRILRSAFKSSENVNIEVNIGDICYIDFGHAYLNESGYQHFGLVIQKKNHKLLVVPMSSKKELIHQASNVDQIGAANKRHLYYLGQPEGMSRESVLFLNDTKFINSARVIGVTSQITPETQMFKEILKKVSETFVH
ncbi:hypothetical protein [Erysipelothrix larvae]|nr:hypothetical protein [Erysipelothrix larvae]